MMEWNDEQVGILLKMRDEGATAGDIGNALGTSPGSVSGKVKRLNLPPLPRSGSMILARVDRAPAEPMPPRGIVGPKAFTPLVGTTPAPFGSPGCKWPVGGSGADTLCCGEPKADSGSYCPTHHAVAHVAFTPKLKLAKGAR